MINRIFGFLKAMIAAERLPSAHRDASGGSSLFVRRLFEPERLPHVASIGGDGRRKGPSFFEALFKGEVLPSVPPRSGQGQSFLLNLLASEKISTRKARQ
jgi:hypothetical protein